MTFYCIDMAYFLYPFVNQPAFELFPHLAIVDNSSSRVPILAMVVRCRPLGGSVHVAVAFTITECHSGKTIRVDRKMAWT